MGFYLSITSYFSKFLLELLVNELAPDKMRSLLGCFVQMAIALGIFVIYAFSLGFTESEDPESVSHSFLWRFSIAFATILAIIQVILLISVFPYESPQYYISVNKVFLNKYNRLIKQWKY